MNVVHKLIAEKKGLESESRKIEDGVFGDVNVIKTEKNDKETLQLPEFSSGVSDENWDEADLDLGYHPTSGIADEADLDLGYHPTSEIADEPPEMGDEQIEGAWSAPPLDDHPQEGTDVCIPKLLTRLPDTHLPTKS